MTVGIIAGKVVGLTGKFGSATDYSEFEADGTQKEAGASTYWKDVNIDLGPLRNGGTAPGFTEIRAGSGIFSISLANNEEVSGVFEIPHECKLESAMQPHIHFIPSGAVSAPDNAKFQLLYQVMYNGSAFSATSGDINTGDIAITTQYAQVFSNFTGTIANAAGVGAHLYFTLRRIAASANDYAGTIHMGTFGLHIECDTQGSRTVSDK